MLSLLTRHKEPSAAESRPPSENQLTRCKPPDRYGNFNGQRATRLHWKRRNGVWRSYWPCGDEQPVRDFTGRHKCADHA